MHDTRRYMSRDPIYRKYHHNDLTFRMLYAFHENFVLPLSHDEVVHGKGSLLGSMPGDLWQKFANLRALFGYMWAQSGKKLLFMGGEFGQWNEWNHETSLDWHLLQYDTHRGVQRWVADLNRLYRAEPALHELDFEPAGFEWVDANDAESSVISFLRRGRSPDDVILVVANFTPVVRHGLPGGGAEGRVLEGAAQQRCEGVRRQRRRQSRRQGRRPGAVPRPALLPRARAAAARRDLPEAGGVRGAGPLRRARAAPPPATPTGRGPRRPRRRPPPTRAARRGSARGGVRSKGIANRAPGGGCHAPR